MIGDYLDVSEKSGTEEYELMGAGFNTQMNLQVLKQIQKHILMTKHLQLQFKVMKLYLLLNLT